MPLIHHARREIQFKIVYYGPGLGGKTTNRELVHKKSKPQNRGKLVSLNTEAERTLFFDLLPVQLGKFMGYTVRTHLCTVPGQIAHDRTRQMILRNVDGIVFVVDSQADRLDDNVASIRNLETNLILQGDDPSRMPLVVQYNKRDLPTAMDIPSLREALCVPEGATEVEACAVTGRGVFPTFKGIVKSCMALVGDPKQAPEGRTPSQLPDQRHSSMFPAAARNAAGDSEVAVVPKAPRVPHFTT